jgi:hypothetical protein
MNYQEVFERAKQFTGLDKEMDKRLMHLADRTWSIIGGDVLQCQEGCGEKAEMKRSHVIEVVCDADYMLMHGGDAEAYAYYVYLRDSGQRKHINKLMREAFPYNTYGY